MTSILCCIGLHSKVPTPQQPGELLVRHELMCRRRCGARWGVVSGRGFIGDVRRADRVSP